MAHPTTTPKKGHSQRILPGTPHQIGAWLLAAFCGFTTPAISSPAPRGDTAIWLVKAQKEWGLRDQNSGNFLLNLNFQRSRFRGHASDSIGLRICADSLTIRSTTPDTDAPEDDSKTIHGPFHFGALTHTREPESYLDLMSGTEAYAPWIAVSGRDGSGFVFLYDLPLCPEPSFFRRIRKPQVVRRPFTALFDSLVRANPNSPRQNILVTISNTQQLDTVAHSAVLTPSWLVIWNHGDATKPSLISYGSSLEVRQHGQPIRSAAFEEPYPRLPLRAETWGPKGLVLELASIYGDGSWHELIRIQPNQLRIEVICGESGGEGHELDSLEVLEAERNTPGKWWIDPTTGGIWLKQKHQASKRLFSRP